MLETKPADKTAALVRVLDAERPQQAIVFVRTKIRCEQLFRTLRDKGMNVKALHGDMSQGARDGVMISFKEGRLPILVATDVAARGLDIVLGHPHRQLRHPDLARRLRAPHRAHRPRRALGPGDHVRRAAPAARARGDRAPRQHDDRAVDRGRARRARARGGQAAPPLQAPDRPQRRRAAGQADRAGRPGAGHRGRRHRPRGHPAAGLDGEAIHNVRVLERFAFLEVPVADAERVIAEVNGAEVRGHELRIGAASN